MRPAAQPARPLSFPHPPLICLRNGDWQLQVLPGAPGTARQGRTRTIVSTNDGGKATQPRAPGHGRPLTAQRAARHGRLSADSGAPGADVPPTTTAGAPGQYCLSAALQAPGHGRPLAITAGVPCRDRLSAAPRAPGDDAALAATAMPPSHHRPSAAPIATVALPAGLHRLRQECLPRVPANPRILTYSPSHLNTAEIRTPRALPPTETPSSTARSPLSTWWKGAGGEGRHPFSLSSGRPLTTHQVHPVIQVPPHPRSCSTADTGFLRQHPSRAPPTSTHRKPILANRFPPLHHVERGRG